MAGKISAQAGELMTMMGTSMSDEEFEELTNAMLEHEKQLLENHLKYLKRKNKQGKLIDNHVQELWISLGLKL